MDGEQAAGVDSTLQRATAARAPVLTLRQAGVLLGLVGLVTGICLALPAKSDPWHDFFDLRVYHGAVQWWLDGRPLYEFRYNATPYGLTYPPFAGLLLVPSTLLSFPAMVVVHTVASATVLVLLVRWLITPLARRHGWALPFAWLAALPLAFLLEPVRETLGFGQVNLLLAGLVLADVVALRRGWRWAGAGTGLAAAVKLTPAVFVLYLLVTRRLRAAGTAVAVAGAATLVTFAVTPGTSWQFWTETLWQTERVGQVDKVANQSLLGGLARLADPDEPSRALWAVLAVVVLAVALTRAARAVRAGDELAGIALTGLAACLVSPISWTHHFVWLLPACVVLLDLAAGRPRAGEVRRAARARWSAAAGLAAVVLIWSSSVVWAFDLRSPHHWDDGWAGMVPQNAYLLVTLALVLLLPARAPVRE
ncbi:glycosyltransferase 87 family protein [Blastococcus sp. TF02-9]|uniref:glycosyltransferase 87 family protein n=1 Tax=Blastococcus sp. TF02-09 TaxID=2250576 RepID=UPI0013146418|nr:glycosyltransferase 87 family protein [Blastococcus sp. TF02-9]